MAPRSIDLHLFSLELGERARVASLVALLQRETPELAPVKWGHWEPLPEPFDGDVERMLAGWPHEGTLMWRGAKPRSWVSLDPRVGDFDVADMLTIQAPYNADLFRRVAAIFDAVCTALAAQLATLHVVGAADVERGERLGYVSYERPYAEDPEPHFVLVPIELPNGLPDLFWSTAFGPLYIELFGRDRLEAAGAAFVTDDLCVLQLGDDGDTPVDEARRAAAKRALGERAFRAAGDPAPDRLVPDFVAAVSQRPVPAPPLDPLEPDTRIELDSGGTWMVIGANANVVHLRRESDGTEVTLGVEVVAQAIRNHGARIL